MTDNDAKLTLWFWSPDGSAMDLRHYDTETHVASAYEGFNEMRSTPFGVANTSEFNIWCCSSTPNYEDMLDMKNQCQEAPLLVCEPVQYHDTKAFGIWSLEDHADCIWVGDVDENPSNGPEIVFGGSVTVMYNRDGRELWRYEDSIESQHIALGKFRDDMVGLQIAGLDRIVREDQGKKVDGKDGMFLLNSKGEEVWKENRTTKGWLTIIDTLRNWDGQQKDYIIAYRRGGGVNPTLYDGHMNTVVTFPVDGYVIHADLFGRGKEDIIIYDSKKAYIFSSEPYDLNIKPSGTLLTQTKRLYSSTLYPGGEI
jgi:hypothetical protein